MDESRSYSMDGMEASLNSLFSLTTSIVSILNIRSCILLFSYTRVDGQPSGHTKKFNNLQLLAVYNSEFLGLLSQKPQYVHSFALKL